jgi:hypothetical protein
MVYKELDSQEVLIEVIGDIEDAKKVEPGGG